ncbi:Zn-ribbon domain-containing OB-fold protein [Pseudomonas sp. I2]|uniref:Zn-ribbon domain-containing OB-fold protein n=1 Tax=Pseudomonas sp. I2 TaxID=1338438 RepID=UPI0034D5E11F
MTTALWSDTAPAALLASRHRTSGRLAFPPLPEHSPLHDQYVQVRLPDQGHIYSFTLIHPSPKSGLAPFALAYLDVEGPVRLFGRVNGQQRPRIGERCRIVADDTYGYSFEPMEAGQ